MGDMPVYMILNDTYSNDNEYYLLPVLQYMISNHSFSSSVNNLCIYLLNMANEMEVVSVKKPNAMSIV